MNFDFDRGLDIFRSEVRAFLQQSLPDDISHRNKRGFHETQADVQAWTRILHAKGWSAPAWPVEYGGTGWSPVQQLVFDEEAFAAGAPPRQVQGLSLAGPIIYSYGSEAQKQQHLPAILNGDSWWAQGFSEPNAGSDLAALKTTAVKEGDSYIVNGQKAWTTMAQHADWLFLLVRTNTEVRPQKGISFLLARADGPGVSIRPVISIDGGHSLNEVFLDNVHVPCENLVGEENAGWGYAKFLLDHERAVSAEVPRNKYLFSRLLRLATQSNLIEQPDFAAKVAELEVELMALEFMTLRVLSEAPAASARWSAGSVLHVRGSQMQQKLGELMLEAMGEWGGVYYPEYHDQVPQNYPAGLASGHGVVADFMYRRSTTIYGGSNEIQRTLIARNLLGAL